jgi:hypothetical protein
MRHSRANRVRRSGSWDSAMTSFSATSWPVARSSARYTRLIPPCPTNASISKRFASTTPAPSSTRFPRKLPSSRARGPSRPPLDPRVRATTSEVESSSTSSMARAACERRSTTLVTAEIGTSRFRNRRVGPLSPTTSFPAARSKRCSTVTQPLASGRRGAHARASPNISQATWTPGRAKGTRRAQTASETPRNVATLRAPLGPTRTTSRSLSRSIAITGAST